MRNKRFIQAIAVIGMVLFTSMAFAQGAASEKQQDLSFWQKISKFVQEHTFLSALIFLTLATVVSSIFGLMRKDKCLKKQRGKYVTLQLRDGRFYKGMFRLETNGLEIVSEKSRVEGKEASFLLSGKIADSVHAIVRYHDQMLDREKMERDNELEKLYHPRLGTLMKRRVRTAFATAKNAVKEAFSMTFEQIKKRSAIISSQERYMKQMSQEALEYSIETVYDRLIDRLVGTKVVVVANNQEYEGVLSDYTSEWLELMEVNYKDSWDWVVWHKDYRRGAESLDPHGLKFVRDGDKLTIHNHGPFSVRVGKLIFSGDQPTVEWGINKTIEPFGKHEIYLRPVAGVNIAPFAEVKTQVSIPFHAYKEIKLTFETWRMADITMPRGSYASIRHRSEKYEPKLLSLSTITSVILNNTQEDFLLTDKNGQPLKYINVHHGYITNLEKDRMDVKEAAQAYSRRWEVERLFQDADSRLRPIGLLLKNGGGKITPRTRAMFAQIALMKLLHLDKTIRKPKPEFLYYPLAYAGKARYREVIVDMPIKVLALTGNVTDLEYQIIQQFKAVGTRKIIYGRTSDKKLPRLDKSDILWIGYCEAANDRYQFNYDIDKKIKTFVMNGGVVIAMGQKSQTRRSGRTTWLPEPISGRASDQIREFDAKAQSGTLFEKPNRIKSGHMVISDPWIKWSDRYEVLATVQFNGQEAAAILKLDYGDGMFIVTALKNETNDNVKLNAPIMQNLIYYAVNWINRRKEVLKKSRRWAA